MRGGVLERAQARLQGLFEKNEEFRRTHDIPEDEL
jgi:hypothetical protein